MTIEWFADGALNASFSCLDSRAASQGDRPAILWAVDAPGDRRRVKWADLQHEVSRPANALKSLGVVQGDIRLSSGRHPLLHRGCGLGDGPYLPDLCPLANGATIVLFEGVPTWPDASRWWEIIEAYKVSVFYTAPTAIGPLMRKGEAPVHKHDLSSLRVPGSVGEPINPAAEAAVVGFPYEIKGQGIFTFVTLKEGVAENHALRRELAQIVRTRIGPIATPDRIEWAPQLPKNRSGKILRRILTRIAAGDFENHGDTSTVADPSVVAEIVRRMQAQAPTISSTR